MWQPGLVDCISINQPVPIHCVNVWTPGLYVFPFWIENMHQTPSIFLLPPFFSVCSHSFEMTMLVSLTSLFFLLLSHSLGLSPWSKKGNLFFPFLPYTTEILLFSPQRKSISILFSIYFSTACNLAYFLNSPWKWFWHSSPMTSVFPNPMETIKSLFTDLSWLSARWHHTVLVLILLQFFTSFTTFFPT